MDEIGHAGKTQKGHGGEKFRWEGKMAVGSSAWERNIV